MNGHPESVVLAYTNPSQTFHPAWPALQPGRPVQAARRWSPEGPRLGGVSGAVAASVPKELRSLGVHWQELEPQSPGVWSWNLFFSLWSLFQFQLFQFQLFQSLFQCLSSNSSSLWSWNLPQSPTSVLSCGRRG